MKFLGIDPGLATIGYAVIEEVVDSVRPLDYGCLTTPAGMPFGLWKRLCPFARVRRYPARGDLLQRRLNLW